MAGWIPLEKKLLTDIRFIRLVIRYEQLHPECGNGHALSGNAQVLGGLSLLWLHADVHADENDELRETKTEIDAMLGWSGFCEAMPPDWLVILPDGRVKLPNFHEHNGSQARAKYLGNKRQAEFKARKKSNGGALPGNDNVFTTRPDHPSKKEREAIASPKKEPSSNAKRDLDRRRDALTEARLTPGLNVAAWDEWLRYRTDIRKPFATGQLTRQAQAMVEGRSYDQQAKAVKFTIDKGYQGLTDPASGTGRAWSPRLTQESALAAIDAAHADRDDSPYKLGDDEPIKYDG